MAGSKKKVTHDAYMKARRNYLQMVNRYIKQGYEIDTKKFKPIIPKKTTEASMRRLESLTKKLKETVHEQRVETGYYVRLREQKARTLRIKKSAAKQTQTKPQKQKTYKTPVKIPTQIPKVKGRQSTPPNLSDAVLRTFESEIQTARSYLAKSKAYQEAVNNAGNQANDDFANNIEDIFNKYMPDITRHEVRVEVANNLFKRFDTYMTDIEAYLYEFISDGQGHLDHTEQGKMMYQELLKNAFNVELSDEDKEMLEELINDNVEGFSAAGIGEDYDY